MTRNNTYLMCPITGGTVTSDHFGYMARVRIGARANKKFNSQLLLIHLWRLNLKIGSVQGANT